MPRRSKFLFASVGMNTSRISRLTFSRPPTSDHFTLGMSTRTSLIPLGSTSARASVKSFMVTFILSSTESGIGLSRSNSVRFLLRHFIAASRARDAMSAPTNPWVIPARDSMFTSSAKGIPLRWTLSISVLPSRPGIPISISRSNLPGLRRAGSMESSLFVAPRTITSPLPPRPSIRVSS